MKPHPDHGPAGRTERDPTRPQHPIELLVVDDEPAVRDAIVAALAHDHRTIHQAGDIADACRTLQQRRIDLALIDPGLPDGDGLSIITRLRKDHPLTRFIVVTGHASLQRAIDAIRAGATDFLSKPLNIRELNDRVAEALRHQRLDTRQHQRVQKLRRRCRELAAARSQITEQVDILCSDLVTAYQELAGQVQQLEMTEDLRASFDEELDLEQTLRKVMEFLLDRVGSTNIAMFLPASEGGYTVGGFVNYSYDKTAIRVLLDHLAQTAAPALAERPDVIHTSGRDAELDRCFERAQGWLADCDVLATACRDDDGESLAAVMLFRTADERFTTEHADLLEAVAGQLAEHLVKVIRVHHRMSDFFDDSTNDGEDGEDGGSLAA